MTPHQRAEAILATQPWPPTPNDERLAEEITTAIQSALNEELERGRARLADAKQALQAALGDLERVTRERDALKNSRWIAERAIADRNEQLEFAQQEMARGTKERDGLAAALAKLGQMLQLTSEFNPSLKELLGITADPAAILAAHDRAVAARVLKEAGSHVLDGLAWDAIKKLADAYELGQREVPA